VWSAWTVSQSRAVLQRVLAGRLVFAPYPEGVGASFEAPTRYSGLFAGVIVTLPAPPFIDPNDRRGTEAIWAERAGVERTYEAVLARAEETASRMEKGGRPWRVSNPRPRWSHGQPDAACRGARSVAGRSEKPREQPAP
jgi:hypothetical protein